MMDPPHLFLMSIVLEMGNQTDLKLLWTGSIQRSTLTGISHHSSVWSLPPSTQGFSPLLTRHVLIKVLIIIIIIDHDHPSPSPWPPPSPSSSSSNNHKNESSNLSRNKQQTSLKDLKKPSNPYKQSLYPSLLRSSSRLHGEETHRWKHLLPGVICINQWLVS